MITRTMRLTAIFIFFLIIISLFTQIISSNVLAEQSNAQETSEEPRIGLIGKLVKRLAMFLAKNLFPIFRLSVVSLAAEPPVIEIGYNETVNVEIGLWDIEGAGGFKIWDKEKSIFTSRFLDFQIMQYPTSNDQGSWFVKFEPYSVSVSLGSELKTNMSITLTKPPISSNPIQSGILKVKVFDTWAYGNLYFPPNPDAPIGFKIGWFISATITMRYGKMSGTVITEEKDVDILVKIKPYHEVRFDTSPTIYLKPDQVTSIPITLQNLGNYNDTYGFRIKSKNDDIKLAAPFYITLAPGELSRTYLGVSTPMSAFDYGTLHEIIIETYSIDEPNVTIVDKQVLIETQGVYVSEMIGIGFVFLIILIILLVAFFMYRRRLFFDKICVKPDKPWEIPEEKKYLETLYKSDKGKYKETLEMMENEYESALLWYKDYCKKITEPKPVKKKEIKRDKKEKIKPMKEKFKFQLFKKEKKAISEEKPKKEIVKKEIEKKQIIEKKEEMTIDRNALAEEQRKQKAISRIKMGEDKQKRKFKK